jgi:hypothetical protein
MRSFIQKYEIKQKIDAFCNDKRNTASVGCFVEEKLKQLEN